MLQQFSKIFLALFIFAGVFFSCTKDDDEPTPDTTPTDTVVVVPPDTTGTGDTTTTPDPEPEPEPTAITVTGSDYEVYQKIGSKATFKTLNNLQIGEFPASGENQVWDLRAYETTGTVVESTPNLPVPDSTIFTSATFITTQQSTFIPAFTFSHFYEVSEEGYYIIGNKVDAGVADLGNGTTLTAPGNEDIFEPKELIFKFPMNYNDVTEQTAVYREDYSLTAPAFGITNAPVQRQLTFPKKSEVLGWGKVILPEGAISDTTEVLLVKNTSTSITNYFLNGNTAPNALLSALNLTEGSRGTAIYYYFMSKEYGIIASFTFATDRSGDPIFPAAFARYVETKE
ncbi:MAG: hypothetical protein COZ18_10695 [Flexibacter sp. CG_4_10_14_3_um_filter_32_15]|nr:MAG: hypothetical protein COZ18_10695 [Flexibacter sp. CG_4_10_14_3_um_filter_32_15]